MPPEAREGAHPRAPWFSGICVASDGDSGRFSGHAPWAAISHLGEGYVFDHMLLSLAGGPVLPGSQPLLDSVNEASLFLFFLFCDDATCSCYLFFK